MKKMFKPTAVLLLSTAVAFNVSADTQAEVVNASVATKVVVANTSISNKAEVAKKAYDEMMAKSKQFYNRIETWSFVEKFDVRVEDYTVGDNQSEATEVAEIKLRHSDNKDIKKAAKTSKVVTKSVITYNDDLTKKGIIAHIESTNVKEMTLVDGKESDVAYQNQMIMDIYANGDIHRQMKVEAKDDKTGFYVNYHTNMSFVDKGYGKFDGKFTNLKKADVDNQFDSLNFEGEYSAENGLVVSSTSPIISKKDGKLTTINGLTFKGKMIDIPGVSIPLPSFSFIAQGIVSEVTPGVTATMDVMSFSMNTKASKSGGVDLSFASTIKPSGTWMKQVSQDKLNLTNISAELSFGHLPVTMINQLSDEVFVNINEAYDGKANEVARKKASEKRMNELFEKNGDAWFTEMQKKGSGPSFKFNFESDKGNGFVNLDARLQNAGLTVKSLKDSAPSPDLFLSLFDVKGKSGLPADLIETLKVQMYLAMVYRKKGNAYLSDIETRDGQLMVNDVPFDLSMFFPVKKASKK